MGMSLFQANDRWRGVMPFRQTSSVRNLLAQRRRTGEPSLAYIMDTFSHSRDEGHGKAEGSFTETFRQALWDWMEKTLGSRYVPLTFHYKLYRKRTVLITGTRPYLKHDPRYGRGKKGFVLVIKVQSIDGVRYRGMGDGHLAWDRIIGNEKMLCLPEARNMLPVQPKEREDET